MKKEKLTHVGPKGEARMVDIGGKAATERRAIARGRVLVSPELLMQLRQNTLIKGDALAAARIAGIMAAKKTADIIPLCHPLPLAFVGVDLELKDNPPSVEIRAEARTAYMTGVEMEALVAVSAAALTLYDMGKAVDRSMTIDSIRLIEKEGGRSGRWVRGENE
jgi:cyclic pyranopterin phosphate synthase